MINNITKKQKLEITNQENKFMEVNKLCKWSDIVNHYPHMWAYMI